MSSHPLEQPISAPGNQTSPSNGNPGHIAFVLVPVFFVMGLLGIFICHVLKKKGYRCTTDAESEEKIQEEKAVSFEPNDTLNDSNTDTVGHIVHFIMKNEANSEALKAMVLDTSIDPESPTSPATPGTPISPTTPVTPSPGVSPTKHTCHGNHLHTVGGVAERNVCSRCSHKRWGIVKPITRTKEPKKSRPGEVTLLTVGRFRVTKADQKSHPKERKILLSESEDAKAATNGEVPGSPAKVEPNSRSASESQEFTAPEQ
ncbi:RELT-like protein 1 [Erpetoichthys calabaricus]|nr:RELT-like protein 1 [Erpetoichthys calabaricus]